MKARIRPAATPRAPAITKVQGNVIALRARRQLSQAALAELAGISRATLSNIERGDANVTIDVLERLSLALDVEIGNFFEPVDFGEPDDDEIVRRGNDSADNFIDAFVALEAIEEAAGRPANVERYSKAGRPIRR